jgi:hypothetical protein
LAFKINKLRPGMVITPLIPALRRLRQEDGKFEASLGYTVSSRPTLPELQNEPLSQKTKIKATPNK